MNISQRYFLLKGVALVLLLTGGWGTVHAVRVAAAQVLYHAVKYGTQTDADELLRLAEQAYRLYPFHYWLCAWAGELAYERRMAADGSEQARRVAAAETWCQRGLQVNPYLLELRELKARLLARKSPAAAAAYWREYVDWHFWFPDNHAFLAELYAEAGDFDLALEELKWAQRSSLYETARCRVLEKWEAEKRAIEAGGRP